jgi:tRNA threonylcarbamoyladenosine modification (KEOPS) complex  Pcc1 subunit
LQKMLVRGVVRIIFADRDTAVSVYGAIKPDDKPVPEGLEVETRLEGRVVESTISCERGLASFLATVDDIFRMAALAEKIHKTVKEEDATSL